MNYTPLYKDITIICKSVAGRKDDTYQDLIQEVMLVALKMEELQHRYETDKKYLLTYLFNVAWKMWNLPTTPFSILHKRWKNVESECIEDYKQSTNEREGHDVKEILNELGEIDKLWIDEFLKRDCNVSWLHRDTKIDRLSISKRINEVYDKIRSN